MLNVRMAATPDNKLGRVWQLLTVPPTWPVAQHCLEKYPYFQEAQGNLVLRADTGSQKIDFTPKEIFGIHCQQMARICSNFTGKLKNDVVATVPVHFNDAQRQLVKDSLVNAGFNVLRLINEATAAAIAYGLGQRRSPTEKHYLIFDLGGESCQIAVLGIDDGVFEVKASRIDHFGGAEIDVHVAEHCRKVLLEKHKVEATPRAMYRFRNVCEIRAKRNYAKNTPAHMELDAINLNPEIDFDYVVPPSIFNEVITTLQPKIEALIARVLHEANIDKSVIEHVVLVGGTTKIPKIQTIVQNFFGTNRKGLLLGTIDPTLAIVQGALTQALILRGDDGPTQNIFELNFNGLADNTNHLRMLVQKHEIDIEISESFATISVLQEYQNVTKGPIETIYNLTLPRKTAISKFVVISKDKKIIAVVKETQQAINDYEDAIASGGTGYLLTKSERKDMNEFTLSIGNLPSGEKVTINIEILTPVDFINDQSVFRLPVEWLTISDTFSLNCHFSNPERIVVEKVSHGGGVAGAGEKNQLHVGQRLDRDFVVTFREKEKKSFCMVEMESGGQQGAAFLSFYPEGLETHVTTPKLELIYLIDRSGSMSGAPIENTCKALQALISAIPKGCKFNIIGFGSSQEWLFPESRDINSDTYQAATTHITRISANLGGTDIKSPLQQILSLPILTDYPRNILCLTDGEVESNADVIALVKRFSDEATVSCIGIGNCVDRALVQGMAEAGNGFHKFIENTSDIQTGVIEFGSNLMMPCLSNISITWGGLQSDLTPLPAGSDAPSPCPLVEEER